MGTKIHFYSGKVVELSENEGMAFWGRLSKAGIRFWKSTEQNITVLFNSPTIEYIEHGKQIHKTAGDLEREKRELEKAERQKRIDEHKMTPEDREKEREEMMKKLEDDFMAKSNCTHEQDGKSLRKLYYSETAQGRKYFPVCEFCGHRARYVGLQKIQDGKSEWTIEDVEYAKLYEA